MRTTISLNDRIFEAVKRRAAAEGLSVSAYVAAVLDDAVKRSPEPADERPFRLVTVGGGGPFSGIDLDRPRLLMVDEPFLGLAPAIVQEMKDAFARVNAEGVSILFIEQNVQVALNMCSRAYILESGRLALHGRSDELLESPAVKRIFLGA